MSACCVCKFGISFTYVIESIDSKLISLCLMNVYSLIADLHIFVFVRAKCASISIECTKVKLLILNNLDISILIFWKIQSLTNNRALLDHTNLSTIEAYEGQSIHDSLIHNQTFTVKVSYNCPIKVQFFSSLLYYYYLSLGITKFVRLCKDP